MTVGPGKRVEVLVIVTDRMTATLYSVRPKIALGSPSVPPSRSQQKPIGITNVDPHWVPLGVVGEMPIFQQPEVPVMVFGMDWWDN
jgi:hypothetical protein